MRDLAERKSKLEFAVNVSVRERGKARQVVLAPRPLYLSIRLKGCKRVLTLDYEWIWQTACKKEAERIRAERKAKKQGRT